MNTIKSEVISWPIAGSFRISRSVVTQVDVVVVTLSNGLHIGRGECRPYPRYNETPESVCAQIDGLRENIESLSHDTLGARLPSGAARNAVDCALWDLKAQIEGKALHELMGLPPARPRPTAFTLSLDTAENMAKAAHNAAQYQVLKIKVGHESGLACALAVLEARPDVQLIIDANEALSPAELIKFQNKLANQSVALIEQPLPAGTPLPSGTADRRPIICADEALHTKEDLKQLWSEGYRAVNIKLDKAGGLSEALELAKAAKEMGFHIMLGCMVSSSLSMAPAILLESYADTIDLDGALLLSRDHEDGMIYENGKVIPAPKTLWGYPRALTEQA